MLGVVDQPPSSAQPRSFVDRIGILRPLRLRDFRLLWIGSTVSFIGDGIYVVAMALQVLELSNRAGTLAYVGIAWATPQVALSLVSGALSDRIDRRRLMIAGDLIRLAAISAIGVLSILGTLTVPLVIVLVVVFGIGQSAFGPSFSAITPSIVPENLLVEANGLGQFARPVALLMLGPIFGGLLVGVFGPGWAFILDGATFAWSAVMIYLMRVRTESKGDTSVAAVWLEMKAGLRYVLETRWLAVGMFAATVSLFVVWGPWETLVPYIVKNDLVVDPADEGLFLGLVFGAGGVGALLAGLVMGQRSSLPRKPIVWLYGTWALGMFVTAGFGIATEVWHAMVFSFVAEGSIGILIVIWFTLLQRLVPIEMLGRVTSLDWMITISGVPLSFAVVGPAADTFGADPVMIWAGVIGGLITIAFLFVPGARDPERDGSLETPIASPTGG